MTHSRLVNLRLLHLIVLLLSLQPVHFVVNLLGHVVYVDSDRCFTQITLLLKLDRDELAAQEVPLLAAFLCRAGPCVGPGFDEEFVAGEVIGTLLLQDAIQGPVVVDLAYHGDYRLRVELLIIENLPVKRCKQIGAHGKEKVPAFTLSLFAGHI